VVFVDRWDNESITSQKLQQWRNELAPHFDDISRWSRVIEKTTDQYWWKLVAASYYTGRGYSFMHKNET
jgi:hypothetical protein